MRELGSDVHKCMADTVARRYLLRKVVTSVFQLLAEDGDDMFC